MGGPDERVEEPDGVAALDLENAYGRFHRSSAVSGMLSRVPKLQKLVFAEWCGRSSKYWQRVDGSWRAACTSRGGWQGSRLAMIMFCFSLEDAFQAHAETSGHSLCRVGYQDDTYIVGNIFDIQCHWDVLVKVLEKGGHKINATKSNVWMPCLGDVPTDSMPLPIQEFVDIVPRSANGLVTMQYVS